MDTKQNRDQLAYISLATGRQLRAYRAVREHHAVTVSRFDCRNDRILDDRHRRLLFATGGWA